MQFGLGTSEEAIGLSGPVGSDRQTAREFLGKMENVQRRMVREALHAASTILLPLAEAFRALDSQFLPFPKVLRMLGQNALIDPQTGAPIPPDQSITLQDVILRYDMRAASAASLIGRSAKQQNTTLLLQALGGPLQNPLINWQAFYRKVFRDFEENNPDEFIMPMTPEQMMLFRTAQMMAALPAQSSGNGKKASASGSPSAPNSDILDQMVQPGASAELGALGTQ